MPHQEHKKTLLWINTSRFMGNLRGHEFDYQILTRMEQIWSIQCMSCV